MDFKTSYSHGLESIYALETVDVRSIRTLKVEEVPKDYSVPFSPFLPPIPSQLELNLGKGFREWVPPSIWEEPIQVLGLSRHAERSLVESHKLKIGDLQKRSTLSRHLEEISEKFEQYLRGKDLEKKRTVDFGSWIRALFQTDRLGCFLLLEPFEMEELALLMPLEQAEIKRMTAERRFQIYEQALHFIKTPEIQSKIKEWLSEITEAFIRTWVYRRQGLAREGELIERLQKRSEFPGDVTKILRFLAQALQVEKFPFSLFLPQVEENLYTAYPWLADDFESVVACAKTYFTSPAQSFLLPHLVSLIEREKAALWRGFERGFVEKALRLSSRFQLWKRQGQLFISPCPF